MSQATIVALVTGANRGIGFEIVRQLGEQGMTVLMGARNLTQGEEAARSLQADGMAVQVVQLDITDQATIDAVAAFIDRMYGKLDVLVNNAGIAVPGEFTKAPSEVEVALLKEIYETNVFGTFAVTKTMLPLLRRSQAGRIVNQSSGMASLVLNLDAASYVTQMPPLIGYSSSKTALNALTVLFARELQDTSIKINSVSPGLCATDLNGHQGQPPALGAQVAVHLSMLGPDGPTGSFFEADAMIPW